ELLPLKRKTPFSNGNNTHVKRYGYLLEFKSVINLRECPGIVVFYCLVVNGHGCSAATHHYTVDEIVLQNMSNSCVEVMNYWDQIRNYLQSRVSLEGYQNWLQGSTFVGLDADTLLVSVPDRETRTWLETEYASFVRNGIRELGLPIREVSYQSEA